MAYNTANIIIKQAGSADTQKPPPVSQKIRTIDVFMKFKTFVLLKPGISFSHIFRVANTPATAQSQITQVME